MAESSAFSLAGKVAVVTGGASGIGEATARRFARSGAKVVIGDLADATAIAKEIGGLALRTDVCREAQVERLLESAVRELGRLDVLVNNAGGGAGGFLATLTEQQLDATLSVNLKGVVWGIKHAASRIADGGSIMSTASVAGLLGTPSYGSYVASKAAIIGITKTAALELAPRAVRVNCVCPGTIDTPMARGEKGEVEPPRACCIRSAAWDSRRGRGAFHFWRATRAPSSPARRLRSTAACPQGRDWE
jgi:NAD(P)-dependent dehydrogenase (short-subunit alcohol dehydrogenase family)